VIMMGSRNGSLDRCASSNGVSVYPRTLTGSPAHSPCHTPSGSSVPTWSFASSWMSSVSLTAPHHAHSWLPLPAADG
jgi:hypothetical protein